MKLNKGIIYLNCLNINDIIWFSRPLQYFCAVCNQNDSPHHLLSLSLSLIAGFGRSIAPHLSVTTVPADGGPLQQCMLGWGGASFKDAGGRALLYRGALVPVTPSFHHQRLPVNPAYINFLPGWQQRQGCTAMPALQSSPPPQAPRPTLAPILLCVDEPTRLREQTMQMVAASRGYSGITAGGLEQQ